MALKVKNTTKIIMSSLSQEELFASYRVVRVLGQGSFGKVFLIRNIHSNVEFAMKKYSKDHLAKNGKEQSLIRSVRILKSLSNPAIIDFVYYVIGKEDQIFLIYEVCKKGSLEHIKKYLAKYEAHNIIKQIMHQLAQCLKYLKSVSVAHRDLKPSNITFNNKGELKVIDFDEATCFKEEILKKEIGFSKEFSQENVEFKFPARRSRANSYVGTEMYMSPEMRHRTNTDQRGDLWAFGCILYQLLKGESINCDVEDDEEVQKKIYKKLGKQCPDDLLKNILVVDPSRRLSIEEILSHKYFEEYRGEDRWVIEGENRRHLKKFLKGNYNLADPRTVIDALNMDLIGMKASEEVFQSLNMPIYLLPSPTFMEKLLRINLPKLYVLIGGGKYFKLKHPTDPNQKIYIFYDEIDSISIKATQIHIRCSPTFLGKELKSGVRNLYQNAPKSSKDCVYRIEVDECGYLQAVTDDGNCLGRLYELLIYICND